VGDAAAAVILGKDEGFAGRYPDPAQRLPRTEAAPRIGGEFPPGNSKIPRTGV
jgi:hypothetical protein